MARKSTTIPTLQTQIRALNRCPVRYRSYADAARQKNMLRFGDEGYEKARWEVQYVFHPAVFNLTIIKRKSKKG